MRPRPRSVLLLTGLAAMLAVGCEDPFAPEPTPVPGPQSFVLRDFRAGPVTDASAYDLFGATPVRTDQTEGWDFLFYLTEGGDAQLRPRSVVIDESSSAGVQEVTSSFEALAEVPEDGYTADAPVPAVPGGVYALQSRRRNNCTRYGKMVVDSVDADDGRLFATSVVNPNCNDRAVEPEVDDETDDGDGDGDGEA